MQAELLIQCLFHGENVEIDDSGIRIDECHRQKAFVTALATIIERTKTGASCAIVESSADIAHDIQLLDSSHFRVIVFPSVESLTMYLGNHIQMFFSNIGCLLYLLSLVFTRGIDTILNDMDNAEHTLIGDSLQFCALPFTLKRTIRSL